MKQNITVVSLGPGDPELLTAQSMNAMKKAKRLIFRTAQHPVCAALTEAGVQSTSLDDYYDRYEDFDEMHRDMAKALWTKAEHHAVVFAVLDAGTDGAVRELRAQQPQDAVLRILPGVTLADACIAQLPGNLAPIGALRTIPAEDAVTAAADPTTPLLITEIWNRSLACDLKLRLCDVYGDELPTVLFPSTVKTNRKPQNIQLWEMDRLHTYDHTVCLYLPAVPLQQRTRYSFQDLQSIMHQVRRQCPWDREQTHQTLRRYLIEEAYEAVGAVDEGDMDHLADELGDVLLQVAFHADIAESAYEFTMQDITTAIVHKMLYRHAHIFGNAHCDTPEEVADSWEKLKKAEKGLMSQGSVLADVSKSLPALMRAEKVQKKAAQVGFDWDTPQDALPKVHEEADEVLDELKNARDPGEELGDLLFSCVNVARLSGIDPEQALKNATEKFIKRFSAMENLIKLDEKSLKDLTLSEMDVYWNRVKAAQNRAVEPSSPADWKR